VAHRHLAGRQGRACNNESEHDLCGGARLEQHGHIEACLCCQRSYERKQCGKDCASEEEGLQ